jgi:hypothetical protein
MKVKLLTTISFFTYQLSISQTEKLLHGIVVSQNNPLKKVEVINKTAKTSTRTNDNGQFSILVNVQDSLIFFSRDYFFKRMKVSQQDLETTTLVIDMILKPEELDEVLITTIKFPKVTYDHEAISEIKIEKQKNDLTRFIPGYRDGSIPNGVNFGAIGADLFSLFGKKKEKTKTKTTAPDFKKRTAETISREFFTKELKLLPEEVDLFLEYCDADPRYAKLLDDRSILATMDFLFAKFEEFKKLKAQIKN